MPAKGEIEIVVQGEIGGATIALTGLSAETKAMIDAQLDMMTLAIGRQKSKADLAEKLLAAEINAKMLADLPEKHRNLMRVRAEDRAKMVAAEAAKHEASGRRGDYRMSTSLRSTLDEFDKQTLIEEHKRELKEAELRQDAQLIEAQISRLRAIIAGRDPTDFMPETEAA